MTHQEAIEKAAGKKAAMYKTFEEAKKDWAEKGYTAVRGSEATEADWKDTSKVVLRWA